MKSAAQDPMQADEDPVASLQAPLLAFLAALAVVDAWLTNLPEPTPQTCMITAGAIAGKVFCDNDSEALGLRSMCGLFNNGKNGIQTGVGRYSQVNNNNVGRDVSMVITGRS